MALGKIWHKVVKEILPKETRIVERVANTLDKDEITTIIATMDYWNASRAFLGQTLWDLGTARYRIGDWLGMCIQNEGYEPGNDTAVKVIAHAYIKADGDIDKFIEDLRYIDYEHDRSWEEIDLVVA